ncbi:Cytidine and deoxycytidylate deaminase zinc-binding region [Cardinium endosymbiont of Sogatella furcifera]|uniref:deoxycytidylate deaminase n=1 Tax=Cardinium endosymbiont of Sogatella furcifera TaxID=650378 RepID=UPI000E0DE0C2|nr:dCMP deaminase family protein [Cardinium endosymbiont of Sogatella furcifera]AXI24556.1 Cytidine and deoxycytidylate deaminase zinc-binding region [Cardinium endosymbiont of Sogatella furcifera]
MTQKPTFDAIFMSLAMQLAQRSHCVKKQVGAVLTKETRIISIGYNGPPAGAYNCDEIWPKTGCARNIRGSCFLAIHAEQNAVLYALTHHINVKDGILYTTLSPCLPCARIIFSVGIKKVVYKDSYATYKNLDCEEGLNFLHEFGVMVVQYDPYKDVEL